MFTEEIKWLIGSVAIGALLIFGLVKVLPKGFISGLLGSDRQTIQDTPLAVKEIREIGELISAEYFGEVIHSLNDGFTDLQTVRVRDYYRTLHQTLDSLYTGYALVVDNPVVNTRSLGAKKGFWRFGRSNKENTQEGTITETESTPTNEATSLSPKEVRQREEEIWSQVTQDAQLQFLMSSPYFQLLLEVTDLRGLENKKALDLCKIVKARTWEGFQQEAAYKTQLEAKIDELNQAEQDAIELTYLGRGWVKAGYNLKKLNDEQIDRINDTLIIRDINPEILNADINPWFIPPSKNFKNGSPGFTVLRVRVNGKDVDKVESGSGQRSDRRKVPFWAIDSVKRGTKRALLLDALQSHILDSARTSAERTLLRLFQLVEPDTLAQIQVLRMEPSIWYVRQQAIMGGDYCIDAADTDSLRTYFRKDFGEVSREKDRQALVGRWQQFVWELEGMTLCPGNDPVWNRWQDTVLHQLNLPSAD